MGACRGAAARSVMRTTVGLAVIAALAPLAPREAEALPPGKSWAPVANPIKLPGHTYGIVPMRVEPDTLGRPVAFVEAQGGIGRDMYVLRWQDSTWQSVDHLGYGTQGVRPVPSPPGTHHLAWGGIQVVQENRVHFVVGEFAGDTLSRPDTVTTIWGGSLKYGAAASPVRRWAALGDYGDLRVLYSHAHQTWIEVPVPVARGDEGVAVASLDDTTALVAWRDAFLGPGAGMLRGSMWTLVAPPPMNDLFDAVPQLLPRTSGGHWLSWATARDFIGIASYRDGVWSAPESVFCAYLRPGAHRSQSAAAMSRDEGAYPAVSWMAYSAINGLTSVCVCVPSDSGFTVAENLPGSEEGGAPVVARDRNQDVWVVWEAPAQGMAWAHTYTRATSSAPIVTPSRGKRAIAWWLSEPAPGSWWAVLRAGEGEEFEEVARVRAGPGSAMSWDDLSAPAGIARYRIRRECLDRQYQWLSEEGQSPVDVPPDGSRGSLHLVRASSNPSDALLRFSLLNASAGPLDVQVFDLRGRQLLRQTSTANGTGRDAIVVDLASFSAGPTAGLYFLRVTDSLGRVSPSVKIVFMR